MIFTRSSMKARKRGHNDLRCKEGINKYSTRTCSPTKSQGALRKGDWLDFTFGAGPTLEGFLVYQIKQV
jgi:hypothetical protein